MVAVIKYNGKWTGLPILNYVFTSFSSSVCANRIFHLNNMLHVPTITKNLISVSQFAKDNGVYFEFHPTLCYAKDQVSGQMLLQGTLHDGLYIFNLSESSLTQSQDKPAVQALSAQSLSSLLLFV